MSHDMNPVEHVWDCFSRKVKKRCLQNQTIGELTNAILKEWRPFTQERLCRLVRGMNRRVLELWGKRGGYAH